VGRGRRRHADARRRPGRRSPHPEAHRAAFDGPASRRAEPHDTAPGRAALADPASRWTDDRDTGLGRAAVEAPPGQWTGPRRSEGRDDRPASRWTDDHHTGVGRAVVGEGRWGERDDFDRPRDAAAGRVDRGTAAGSYAAPADPVETMPRRGVAEDPAWSAPGGPGSRPGGRVDRGQAADGPGRGRAPVDDRWRDDEPSPQRSRRGYDDDPYDGADPRRSRRGYDDDPYGGADQSVGGRWGEPAPGPVPVRDPREAAADWRHDLDPEAVRGPQQRPRYDDPAGRPAEYDWRSELADGESRRYGTSDFVPFRSSGSAAVPRASDLSLTSTSMIRPSEGSDLSVRAGAGAYDRRPAGGRGADLLDPGDDLDDDSSGGPLAAVGYTVIWYGVPVVLFVLYMVLVNRGSQSHALDTAANAAPQFGISLVLSMLVAVGLRWASSSWKAISVGLAAAVVGAGLATVLSSAITGNSLS
jgi:hypothetical protein